jgi:hypothetical protein
MSEACEKYKNEATKKVRSRTSSPFLHPPNLPPLPFFSSFFLFHSFSLIFFLHTYIYSLTHSLAHSYYYQVEGYVVKKKKKKEII